MTPQQAKAEAKLTDNGRLLVNIVNRHLIDHLRLGSKELDLCTIDYGSKAFPPDENDLNSLCECFNELGWKISETRWAIML